MGQATAPASTRGGKCPICGAPSAAGVRPFCSARCADVDLARWLGGAYAIPGGRPEADEDGDDARAAEASARVREAAEDEKP